jgi:hypothetical protein
MKELNEFDKKNLALAIFGLYTSQVFAPGVSRETRDKAKFIVTELVHKLGLETEYNFIFRDYERNVLKKPLIIR